MKRLLIYIGILFFGGCTRSGAPRLATGDLLFQAGKTSEMSGAIRDATGRGGALDFSHVGIALHAEGADSVLEATGEGVRIVALRRFLDDAGRIDGHPAVVAMRLRDTAGVAASVARARGAVGLPYDWSFRPDNGKFYCSELIWEYYLTPEGERRFEARPMNFRAADGSMPAFWTELFERLGEPIPEGVAGTNPNDMARAPILEEIGRYF